MSSDKIGILSKKILDLLWFINESKPESELEKKKNTLEYYLPKIKDEHERAETLLEIGKLECMIGKDVEATGRFYECLRLFRRSGDRFGMGKTLYNIAFLHIKRGKIDKAEETLKECIQFADECDSLWLKACCHELLSKIFAEKNEYCKAIENALNAFELFSIVGDSEGMSRAFQNACIYLLKKGETDKVIDLMKKIRSVWKEEDICNYDLITLQLSALLLSKGYIGESEKVIAEFKDECKDERIIAFKNLLKALILSACGMKDEAVKLAERGKKLIEKLYHKKDARYKIAGEVLNAVKYSIL